jgi:CheY-like chemotaxis protein
MPTILCIDDQPVGLAIRKALLESKGYKAVIAENGPEGIALAHKHPIDAVVLDYRMPGMYGDAVAAVLKSEYPELPIVLLSGVPDLPPAVLALVDAYIAKGDGAGALLSTLEQLTTQRRKPSLPAAGSTEEQRTA